MLQPSLDPDALAVGQTLPECGQTFTEVDLVAYGAATWDWHRLHYDMAYARQKQLPGVLIDGQAFGAIFSREAMQWAGPRAFISRMNLKMKSMAFAGDHLLATGIVTAKETSAAHSLVHLNQQLLRNTELVAQATTVLRLPAR